MAVTTQKETAREPRKRRDAEILSIGRQMANVFFNLAQLGDGVSNIHLSANEYEPFKQLWKQWDEAAKKYRESFKRRKAGR